MSEFNRKKEDTYLSLQNICKCYKNVSIEPVTSPCHRNICKYHLKDKTITKINDEHFKFIDRHVEHQTDKNDSLPLDENINNLFNKCQLKAATPIKEIHKTLNESYNKMIGKNNF